MKRTILKILTVFLFLAVLSGCVPRKLVVVTTNYPVEFLVERIAGDRVETVRLDDNAGIAQRAQMRADYNDILNASDVVFTINDLQPYYEVYRDEISNVNVIDLAARSSLYNFERYTAVDINGQKHFVESTYYDSKVLESYDLYGSIDPMLWMDPVAMTSMASTIRDWLVENYPEEKSFFTENYKTLEMELTHLQTQFQAIRDKNVDIRFVSMTPSYGNWQKSYYLSVYPVVLSKYSALPDEALLDDIRQRILADGVKYIAYEDNMPEDYIALYNRLKTELDLKEIKLSNLYTLSEEDHQNDADYMTKMYENLQTLESLTR